MEKRIMKLIITLFLLVQINAFSQTAIELNTQGYELLLKGKYWESLDLFRASFTKDPKYHVAHYNFACSISQIFKTNPCFGGLGDAFEHLRIAVNLNKKYRETIPVDKDLDPIRNYYDFQIIMGLNPNNTDDIIKILRNVNWFSRTPGAFGPFMGITFKENYRLKLWILNMDNFTKIFFEGSYAVYGSEFIINLDQKLAASGESSEILKQLFKERQYFKGRLVNGEIKLEGFDEIITDWDGSCSA